MKKLVIGILAHVDAGKTTLAESMLYLSGSIRKLGRVDHKNAYLDTFELERARGITIFSKQAEITLEDSKISLLDTPGHVDFSTEMERTLQVLDYAILVISGSDGVQGHTETLWRLLKQYNIPTFIFINKMDLNGTDRGALLAELKKLLNDGCIDFSKAQNPNEFMENLAVYDEALLDKYIESGVVETKDITELIADRKIFPCFFGSALKLNGVEEFLNGLTQYTKSAQYSEKFGAKVYKIARDEQGNRLTYMKITGGSLRVKMLLSNRKDMGSAQNHESDLWEEKVDQIRIYSGAKYEAVDEAKAGAVCVVLGLSRTYPGEGLGAEVASEMPVLQPVLSYRILLPPECDAHNMLSKFRQLEEEDPQLHIVWSEQLKEIHIQLMGEVQIEILKSLILNRFGVDVEFGEGNIVYKESILEPMEGVGHFEPLRHYAEVHLLMEPNEHGSGLIFTSNCSEDLLDRNWQRLILTHLEEKDHVGVLTGSSITDMKITLIAGRAHQKHTEGGDFRQATYRAVRQGLKKARCVLLEPYYNFKLEIPSESVGRAMSDIQRMSGDFSPPELAGDTSLLIGYAPVATMRGYQKEVTAYTRGRGRLFCSLKGYLQCHNSDEVIKAVGYDSEADIDNPTSSVFCANGAGFIVEWDKVQDYMHVDSGWKLTEPEEQNKETVTTKSRMHYGNTVEEDKELEAIFVRTYGPIKQRLGSSRSGVEYRKKNAEENVQIDKKSVSKKKEPVKEYLLIDGYNIIFSWDELNEIAKENLEAARNKLMDILCNYQGFKQCILILVFDAYKVKGGVGEILDYHNIHVVFTKEAETADAYIEKVTHEIAREHYVTVATSDALEQLIILGQGAIRLSASDFKEEIFRINDKIRRDYMDKRQYTRNYLRDRLSDNVLELINDDCDT
ncbi:MAG: TetM/TetW/TetO/TetS family tetracycline resistance ribosomal protection protein [Bacillota bacterium]|nr:TetM/TetW/TetO/TetS family tetracycline resistance ribosomal protection protein [Bacillota bacterium]